MKIKIATMLLLFSVSANAQDVIFTKDGAEINSKVLSVGKVDITYKKYSNLQGPDYTIEKSEVFMIKYENGEKDVFKDKEVSIQDHPVISTGPILVESKTSPNNINLLKKYNKLYNITSRYSPKSTNTNTGLTTWGFTEASVLENEDLSIAYEGYCKYNILIKNKSNKTIYIDKGNSYRSSSSGNRCFYTGSQIVTSNSKTSGGALNVGALTSVAGIGGKVGTLASGMTVGGSSSNTTTQIDVQDRFIVIPPLGESYLLAGGNLEPLENLIFYYTHLNTTVRKGEVKNFKSENSPFKYAYMITYSKDQNFETYSTINFTLFLKQVFGTPISGWSYGWFDDEDDIINRRIRDYDDDIIMGKFSDNYGPTGILR